VQGARVEGGSPGEWRILFCRQLGLNELVDWENLCREVQGLLIEEENDEVSWSLEPSGRFSTRSMCLNLSRGAKVTCFKEVWRARVPPKIKIFLWKLIRNRLPSCEQVAKRMGPSNSRCALCGDMEDCNHIFFTCPMAQFMWSGIREILQCGWNPAGAGDFLAIAAGLSGPFRRLVWFTFAA
jgi:hypothetical protein